MASASSGSAYRSPLKDVVLASLASSSVVVKGLCALLVAFYFISFSEVARAHLAVVPGYVLPPNFWVWTLVTHGFLQQRLWLVIIDVAVVILAGKLLEPLWGAMEMLLFFMLLNASAAFMTALVYMAMYFITGRTEYLFETYIHGLPAFIGGFCVAVKQVMPDHVLLTLPFGKLRNKHIPLLMLGIAIGLACLSILDGQYAIMFVAGTLISWIYLRFYQRHTSGSRGDFADSFAFASFFPQAVEAPISLCSGAVFNALVAMKICRKPQRRYDISSPTTITVTLPGTDPQDAERRRQLAIKALNERLNQIKEETSWPSMEEESDAAKSPAPSPTAGAGGHASAQQPQMAQHLHSTEDTSTTTS